MRPSFFAGPVNKPRPGDRRAQSAGLLNPRFVRQQQALSLDVAHDEPPLLRYYADGLRPPRGQLARFGRATGQNPWRFPAG